MASGRQVRNELVARLIGLTIGDIVRWRKIELDNESGIVVAYGTSYEEGSYTLTLSRDEQFVLTARWIDAERVAPLVVVDADLLGTLRDEILRNLDRGGEEQAQEFLDSLKDAED